MSLVDLLLDLYSEGKLCIFCCARFSFRIGEVFYSQSEDKIIQQLFETTKRQVPQTKIDTRCFVCFNMSMYLQHAGIKEEVENALKTCGHEYEGKYSISTSFPQAVFLREQALVRYITRKFPSKNYQPFRIKDTLKFILTAQLPEWKYEIEAPLKLCVEFSHKQLRDEDSKLLESVKLRKRRKDEVLTAATAQQALERMSPEEYEKHFPIPPSPMEGDNGNYRIFFERDYIYVAGRYRKYSRQLSQSQWIINGTLIHDHSISGEIGEVMKKYFKCDKYFLMASGREDVDVRMLGNGRPFVMELHNPRKVALSEEEYIQMQKEINQSPAVQVMHLQLVSNKDTEIIKNGERSKRKKYLAFIWAEQMKPLKMDNLVIHQKTPIRVLHRRSLLTRDRTIYTLKLNPIDDHFGLLELETEAGTYIKEFVHGDLGRTNPNI
ncbi:coiled-coil domain containing protein, putative, partial [Entamoeba invadens IP1]